MPQIVAMVSDSPSLNGGRATAAEEQQQQVKKRIDEDDSHDMTLCLFMVEVYRLGKI